MGYRVRWGAHVPYAGGGDPKIIDLETGRQRHSTYEDVSCIMLGELFQTYAWRTDNLTGWGDWGAHPGRSIDATWTGNILYFELEPAEDDYMTILALAAIAAATAAAATVIVVRYRRKG